ELKQSEMGCGELNKRPPLQNFVNNVPWRTWYSHHCERGSPMKNRKREICTSGSVRDEDGQPPHLLGRRQFLHLASGAAALPAISGIASDWPPLSGPGGMLV